MKSSPSSKQIPGPGAQARAYLATLPPATRRHMQAIRKAIRAAAPDAVESFGYGMPAFALDGKPFVWYAAWKQHTSFYPISKATASALAAEIEAYEISGKGTIRFPLDQPIPAALIGKLVTARIAEFTSARRR